MQPAYGGGDHLSTYRTPAVPSTSKSSQQSTQLGGSQVSTDPMQVNEKFDFIFRRNLRFYTGILLMTYYH